ncbi:Rha family transcriptional regulator [Bosea eneae]|uniref:Rha family transcriptional regulator n=1 Tax=Bosea eneae TaxID=151454 RepID=A0ABW0J154_9HYPH
MSGGDGYLTNPLFREIAALMTQAGIPFRVEQGAKHFHVVFTHLGVERTQILHLGPNNKRSTARKTVIRFRKIVEAERAWREQQTSPELELEQPAMSEQCPPEPANDEDDGSVEFGPVVSLKDGRPTTTSRNIAADFGKSHRDVLRAIDNLIKLRPDLRARNFAQTTIETPMPTGGTRSDRIFEMDRDGFALLAMGFTGERALSWKLSYLGAFNAMEDKLRRMSPPVAAIDTDAMKANAQLAASAAGGAAKNAVTPHMRQIDGKMAHFDDRLTKMAKWFQGSRRETNAKIDALLTILAKPSAVALQMNDYIEIGGVYEVAGVPPNVARRGILSANIRRSLDDYAIDQHVLAAHATVRGQKVRHWPKSLVADWLAEIGHALIDRHLRAHGAQTAQLRLIQS